MRTALLPLLAIAASCASAGSSGSPPPASQTVRVTGPSGNASVRMSGDDASNAHTFLVPPDKVWRALPAVFDSLGIPIAALDPTSHTIGNAAYKVHGHLKRAPLSRFIDCGNSTEIGPNADAYEVSLALSAQVLPGDAGAARLITTFNAVARPGNFAQEYSQCSSKGVIEKQVIDILNARLKP